MPQNTVVLKFGSSVLRSAGDLHIAVDEIYRHWREGCRVLAVVSAFEDVTDSFMGEVMDTIGAECPEATAAYVATGEQQTAALLLGSLRQYGLPARIIVPSNIALVAQGTLLESTPISVDVAAIDALWQIDPILVLPGFYGIDAQGRTALFGRGGSDLSALFLSAALGAECRLCKDVMGVYDADPAGSKLAHRFSALSWERAIHVAGPLIQPKGLTFAKGRALTFEIGRPNEAACTRVGHMHDEWAAPPKPSRPLRIALLGCGVVGRGVYETFKRYAQTFEIRHVLVRNVDRYPDIEHLTVEPSVVINEDIDVVIVCFGGVTLAYSLIAASLSAGKFVVTPNKAAIAAHGRTLAKYTRGADRRLWYSAAVGGAMPALETLLRLDSPVREIRGIVNGTCGVVLEARSQGKTLEEAVAHAQAQGFAEFDPTRDLSGEDSADKLSLLTEAAFQGWIDPKSIFTQGIDSILTEPAGYQLIARARKDAEGLTATVGPEASPPWSFLGRSKGPENRLEIELETGEVIQLKAQGAGRWPTTVSVMGDLHEIARLTETRRQSELKV